MAKRDILNSPRVHPRHAIIELRLCGHCPSGLSASGISFGRFRSHVLKKKYQYFNTIFRFKTFRQSKFHILNMLIIQLYKDFVKIIIIT